MAKIPPPVIKYASKLKPTKKGIARGAVGAGATAGASHLLGGTNPATGAQRRAKGADNISAGLAGAGVVAGTGAYASKKGVLGKTMKAKVGAHRPGKALFALSTGAALVAGYHVARRDKQQGASAGQTSQDVAKAAAGFGVDQKPQGIPEPRAMRAANKGRAAVKGRSQSKNPSF
jgi:hypothetical protein